ncbi:MAG: hypothetical protein JW818_12840 [Pirellulales bacterium]|nr:hypothetical protein [Pirellulales bacterium]
MRKLTFALLATVVVLLARAPVALAQSEDAPVGPASWKPMDAAGVRGLALKWLDDQKVAPTVRAKAEKLWASQADTTDGTELLSRLAVTFALADTRAAELIQLCSKPRAKGVLPNQSWLDDKTVSPVVRANLRLLFGRWLAHERLYDEAKKQLAGLAPGDVIDPASLLFYRSVVYHRLLEKTPGLETIDALMAGESQTPRRYIAVAQLMREDLDNLTEDTLDHIARRMEDIERRLDLGRAGDDVRKVEDGVIKSLDKLIKELEDQQCKNCCAGSNLQSNRPAQDSQLMGGLGPGNVEKKTLRSKTPWGNLPPKQREEALQQIGREFPAHYQDIIEQYFRKMAAEEE